MVSSLRGSQEKPAILFAALLALLLGCGSEPPKTPIHGKVLYNGKPLPFGVVMFQPVQGQVAQAEINSDGTFDLSTYRIKDGVIPGSYRVSVICYEAQDPEGPASVENEGGGAWMGRPLIPLRYTRTKSSGLTAEIVQDNNEEIILELKGPPLVR